MKKSLLLTLALCLLVPSCRNQPSSESPSMMDSQIKTAQQELVAATLDSLCTANDLLTISKPLVESLKEMSGDLSDLNRRVLAQKWALIDIQLLSDWCDRQRAQGVEISDYEEWDILGPFTTVGSQWFCDPNEEFPNIWREVYYCSNRADDGGIDGYFKVMVFLPTEKDKAASVHIFFPMMADNSPRLIFAENAENGDNILGQEIVDFEGDHWGPRHDDIPMSVFGGPEIVEKMLRFDTMYLSFRSSNTRNGSPSESEIAMLPLQMFQDSYWTVVND